MDWINENGGDAELDILEGAAHGYGYQVYNKFGKIGYDKALAFFMGL